MQRSKVFENIQHSWNKNPRPGNSRLILRASHIATAAALPFVEATTDDVHVQQFISTVTTANSYFFLTAYATSAPACNYGSNAPARSGHGPQH
eukprot:6196125-Pleurochrysis_carterae.AAC.4